MDHTATIETMLSLCIFVNFLSLFNNEISGLLFTKENILNKNKFTIFYNNSKGFATLVFQ